MMTSAVFLRFILALCRIDCELGWVPDLLKFPGHCPDKRRLSLTKFKKPSLRAFMKLHRLLRSCSAAKFSGRSPFGCTHCLPPSASGTRVPPELSYNFQSSARPTARTGRSLGRDGIRLHAGAGAVSAAQYLIGDDSEIAAAGSFFLNERCQFIRIGLRKHPYDGRQGIRAGMKFHGRCTPELQETLDLSKIGQELPVLICKRKLPDKVFSIGILWIGFLDHLVDTFPGSRPCLASPGSTLISPDIGIECSKADVFHGGEGFVYPCFPMPRDQQTELESEKILVLIHGAPLMIPSLWKISFLTSSNSSIMKSRASPVYAKGVPSRAAFGYEAEYLIWFSKTCQPYSLAAFRISAIDFRASRPSDW